MISDMFKFLFIGLLIDMLEFDKTTASY